MHLQKKHFQHKMLISTNEMRIRMQKKRLKYTLWQKQQQQQRKIPWKMPRKTFASSFSFTEFTQVYPFFKNSAFFAFDANAK